MKYIILLITVFVLCSCNTSSVDNRAFLKTLPSDELKLVNDFNIAYENLSDQKNEIGEKRVLDSTITEVNKYIKKLNSKIKNWNVIVEEIAVNEDPLEGKTIRIRLLIPKQSTFDKEKPSFDAIQLEAFVNYNNEELKQAIETLKKFDTVSISGKFNLSQSGKIESFSNFMPSKYDLGNPFFKIDLTGIKKLYKVIY